MPLGSGNKKEEAREREQVPSKLVDGACTHLRFSIASSRVCLGLETRPLQAMAAPSISYSSFRILVLPSPFFPGIIFSTKPPETQGNGRFLKIRMVENN